jgi:hypothetical protein
VEPQTKSAHTPPQPAKAPPPQEAKPTPVQECQPGVIGRVTAALSAVAALAVLFWQKLTRDGTLAAAGRQGVDEIGMALKAFPDEIQAHEHKTLFSPTQGEIAADRRGSIYGNGSVHVLRSPQEIAADRGGMHGPVRGNGVDQGRPNGLPPLRSPEEIAADLGGMQQADRGRDGMILTQKEKTPDQGYAEWIQKQRENTGQGPPKAGQTYEEWVQEQREKGIQNGPSKPGQGWEERLQEERGKTSGNTEDGYQTDQNRNKPEEERQKQREQDLGLGL